MRILVGLARKLCDATYSIGALAVGLMMIQVTAHVFFQYVLSYPLPGTYLFVSNYYMVVITFLCLAAVELKDAHVSVDILFSRMSPGWQRLSLGLSQFVTALISALLTWQSLIVANARHAAGTFEIEYGVKILLWPSYYLVPLGAGLLTIVAVLKLIALILDEPIDVPQPPSDLS